MGWIRKRVDEDGKARYQANYRDARGRVQTAGTFATTPGAAAVFAVGSVTDGP